MSSAGAGVSAAVSRQACGRLTGEGGDLGEGVLLAVRPHLRLDVHGNLAEERVVEGSYDGCVVKQNVRYGESRESNCVLETIETSRKQVG